MVIKVRKGINLPFLTLMKISKFRVRAMSSSRITPKLHVSLTSLSSISPLGKTDENLYIGTDQGT